MCDCEECQRGRRVTALREFLMKHSPESDLLEGLDELYSTYVHDSEDHGVLKAIVDNQWPSAEGYMKAKGWVREQKG